VLGNDETPPFDEKLTSVKGKLLRVYQKNGHQYGVIELAIKLTWKVGKFMDREILEGSRSEGTLSIDGCLDGTVLDKTLKGKLQMLMILKFPTGILRIESKAEHDGRDFEVKK